jgi:hypothetical protein
MLPAAVVYDVAFGARDQLAFFCIFGDGACAAASRHGALGDGRVARLDFLYRLCCGAGSEASVARRLSANGHSTL